MSLALRAAKMNRAKINPKIPARFQANFSGYFPSAKNERPVAYFNLIERDFIVLLEDDPAVKTYDEAPKPLKWSKGRQKFVTAFEFSYRLSGERRILAAVKSSATVKKFELAELYCAARASARKKGYSDLKLFTEHEIRAMPRLANAEMKVFQRAPGAHDAHDLVVLRSALQMGGGRMSLGCLRQRCGLGANAYRAIVRLVAEGKWAAADPDVLLDDDADVLLDNDAELVSRGRT
jgi:hypothetical protein